MADYLGQHPDIFMPANKDSTTFGSDLDYRNNVSHPTDKFRVGYDTFLSWYLEAGSEKRLGEASVPYLFSRRAAQEIYEFNSESKVIAMLRNPVEMIYSLHQHFLFDLNEDIQDFEEAIDAEELRRKKLRIPATAYLPSMLVYHEVGSYCAQLQRFWNVFGRDRVHVIIFDDFKRDTPKEYQRTLEFLDVNPTFKADIRIVNPAKRVRSQTVMRFVVNPPWPLRPLAERLSRVRGLRDAVNATLLRLNTVEERRDPMSPAMRTRLQSEFESEVEHLSEMLGRDLTHWTRRVHST